MTTLRNTAVGEAAQVESRRPIACKRLVSTLETRATVELYL
jgi:hypothetical protein